MIEEFMNSSQEHLDSFKEHAEAAAEAASDHVSNLTSSRLYSKPSRPAGYYAKYARVPLTQSRKPVVAAGLVALAATAAVAAFALRRRARTTGVLADEEVLIPVAEE